LKIVSAVSGSGSGGKAENQQPEGKARKAEGSAVGSSRLSAPPAKRTEVKCSAWATTT